MIRIKRLAVILMAAMLLLAAAGCGGEKDTSWIAELNGETVSSGVYTLYMMDGYSSASDEVGSDVDNILNEKIDGQPVTNYITDHAKSQINQLLSIKSMFKDAGLELTQDQKDEAAYYANYYYTTYQQGYMANGVTLEHLTEMYEASYMSLGVFDSIYGEGGEKEVPKAELVQTLKDTYTRSHHIVLLKVDSTTGEALDETALAAVKAQADGYYARAIAGEDLLDLYVEYNNSNLAEGADPYTRQEDKYYDVVVQKGAGSLPTVYSDALETMANGEISMVEDDNYYIIVQKLSFDDADQSVIDYYTSTILQNEKYDEFKATLDELGSRTDVVYNNDALKAYTPKKLKMTNEEITVALIDMGVDVYGSSSSSSEASASDSSADAESSSDAASESSSEASASGAPADAGSSSSGQ